MAKCKPPVLDPLLWLGSMVIVGVALIRIITPHSRLAWWDLDATRLILPETTITPAWSLILDAILWAAVAVVGFALVKAKRPIALPAWGLVMVAAGVAAWHGVFKPMPSVNIATDPALALLESQLGMTISQALSVDASMLDQPVHGSMDSLVRASVWIASLAGSLALMLAARADAALRRVALAALLSVVCVLAFKGAHQFFIEHASTVADFEANAVERLAAQGLLPDSPTAREFERRLRHPDATGWFGLSNVFGSVMAASLLASLGLLARVWRSRTAGELGWVDLSAAAGLASLAALGLYCSQSKGAMVAFVVAAFLAGWLRWSPRLAAGRLGERLPAILPRPLRPWLMPTRRHAALISLSAFAIGLGAILVRGAIDESMSELSLLFRWHYLLASIRIWFEHPLLGVGPGEYQAAYAVAKMPMNPEVVESPHSVLIDWIATLSVGGVAMAVVLLWITWRIGLSSGRAVGESFEATQASRRGERLAMVAAIAGAIAFSSIRQQPTTGPADAIIRVLGCLAMLLAATFIARWLIAPPGRLAHARLGWVGVTGGALVLLLHGNIEMTFTTPGSVGWAMAFLGLAGAGPVAREPHRNRGGILLPIAASALVLATALQASHAMRWEQSLASAARVAHPLAEVRAAVGQLPSAAGQAEVDRLMGTILTSVIPAGARLDHDTMARLDQFIIQYEQATQRQVARGLLQAYLEEPSVAGPLRRAGGLWLAAGDLPQARAAAGLLLSRFPERGSAVAAASLLLDTIVQQTGDPADAKPAATAWARAHQQDPYAVQPAVRLVRLALAYPGSVDDRPTPRTSVLKAPADPTLTVSQAWAERALWNDDLLRLDPLKRMGEAERAWLEGIAAGREGR